MTLASLIAEVYRRMAEAQISNDRLPKSDVILAINDTYEEVATISKCFVRRKENITIVDEQMTYAIPDDMFEIRHVEYDEIIGMTTYKRIIPLVYVEELPAIDPDWRVATSVNLPSYAFLWDSRYIGFYPKPNQPSTTKFHLEGYIVPVDSATESLQVPKLAADSDVPEIPSNYQLLLSHGAVVRLLSGLMLDSEMAASRAQSSQTEYIKLMSLWTGKTTENVKQD